MVETLTIRFSLEAARASRDKNLGRKLIGRMVQEAGAHSDVGRALLPLTHREITDDGRVVTKRGACPFSLVTDGKQITIRATGNGAAAYLSQNAHHIAGWLCRNVKASIPMSWATGHAELQVTNKPVEYEINSFIIAREPGTGRSSKHVQRFNTASAAMDENDTSKLDIPDLERSIRRGIESRCDAIGIDPPEEGIEIRIVDAGTIAPTTLANKRRWPGLYRLRFQSNVRLRGAWNVGPGASKGFGRIRPHRGKNGSALTLANGRGRE